MDPAPIPLERFGWTPFFAAHFERYAAEGSMAGRVARDHQHIYRIYTSRGDMLGTVAGRLRHQAAGQEQFPAVGDWVALKPIDREHRATILAILPRATRVTRKVAGATTEAQVVAANIDTIFLTMGLDGDFNLRRLERYLLLASESGALPVVVLNKTDLCDDIDGRIEEVRQIAPGVPVHATSARQHVGFEDVAPYLQPGRTVALLGSSGVGKSTLINRLLGAEVLRTRAVRAHDSRGRHATTNRELIVLPSGALVIDTPGLRELQLWDVAGSIDAAFPEIDALAPGCHFRDCQHDTEPRCAVRQAVADGRLAAGRLENYLKLRRESAYLAERQDQAAQAARNRKWKIIHKAARTFKPRE